MLVDKMALKRDIVPFKEIIPLFLSGQISDALG
jgi:hypothetical protein